MEYNVSIGGESFVLPPYNLKVSEKIENIEKTKESCNVRKALELMYNCVKDFIGKEGIEKAIGKLNEADPNQINIAYLSIIREYNKPLEEYQTEQALSSLDNEAIDKVIAIIKAAESLKKEHD